jgi:hypothetical protein
MNETVAPLPPPVLPVPPLPPAPPERPRNPVTHARHRHEVLWQVTIPLVIGCVLFLAVAILVVWGTATGGEHGRWAGISLVWLITPMLFVALIFLLLVSGLIFLVTMIFNRLPPFARQVQDFFLLVKYQVAQLDDKLVEPFLRAQSTKSSADTLGRRLRIKKR